MEFSNIKRYFRNASVGLDLLLGIFLSSFFISSFFISIIFLSKSSQPLVSSLKVQISLSNELDDISTLKVINAFRQSDFLYPSNDKVLGFKYASQHEAAIKIISHTEVDFYEILEQNPLKASVYFSIDPFVKFNPENIIELFLLPKESIEIDYEKNIFDSLSDKIKVIYKIVFFSVLVLCFIVLIMLRNLIKLFLYADRLIVKMMMLIGAKFGFVFRFYAKKVLYLVWMATTISLIITLGIYNYLVDKDFLTFLINKVSFFHIIVSYAISFILFSLTSLLYVYTNVYKYAYKNKTI